MHDSTYYSQSITATAKAKILSRIHDAHVTEPIQCALISKSYKGLFNMTRKNYNQDVLNHIHLKNLNKFNFSL